MPWHDRTALKVLIAEDDAAVRELVVTRLELAGFRTAEAKDGLMAMERWRTFLPHIAILDIDLPYRDGFEVIASMRRRERGPLIPTIMLTGRKARADVERARALGVRDYMIKPFDDQDLVKRVGKLAASVASH